MSTENLQKKTGDVSSSSNSLDEMNENHFQPLINRRSRMRSLSRSSYSFNPASETLTFMEHKNLKESLKKKGEKIIKKWKSMMLESNKIHKIKTYLNDKYEQPTWFKFFDKLAFTFGVLNILICQFLLFNLADYFYLWYSFVIPILLISRFYHFRSLNWHYFLIDFCYFTISLTLINIHILYDNTRLFKVCFIYATGVLPMAIPVWRNSLIFHDYDKIVSVFIHILPCMLYYTLRWNNPNFIDEMNENLGIDSPALKELIHEIPPKSIHKIAKLEFIDYVFAIGIYLLWQTIYILKTEFIDREHFEANPELITSLKWLAKDTKNVFARGMLKFLRKLGIFGQNEEYNSASLKTKMVFVSTQLIFTIITILPTPIFYYSKVTLLIYMIIIFSISVFNGASFYIDVFSVRYHQQVKELEMMNSIAKEAQQVAMEISKIAEQEEAARILSVAESFKIENENENVNFRKRSSFSFKSITPRDTLKYLATFKSIDDEEKIDIDSTNLSLKNPNQFSNENEKMEIDTELSSEDSLSPSVLHDISETLSKTTTEAIETMEKIYAGDYFNSITLSLPLDLEREKIKYISIFSDEEEEKIETEKIKNNSHLYNKELKVDKIDEEDEEDEELKNIIELKSSEYDEDSLLAVDR